ncbi:MAG: sigma54 specific transcriptional regulator with sensor, Fis family [Rhodocyclaceae bacterium]|nr:sigma54 specific transcriptional regulator with sensor, Fis family [Rhodocyclaceae bacterium]
MRTISPVPAPLLRQARLKLMEGGEQPGEGIDPRLALSWQRSLAAGLSPGGRLGADEHASGGALQRALARHHPLLSHSLPVMEYLFEQVRDSGSMVILADNRGTLLRILGDSNFLAKAERVALTAGASWHEHHRGTNAIGTALAEADCVEIHGAEHFLDRNAFLTCAAAPIVSATGELLGILDISGDQRSRHPHTLGLVSTSARMIENRLVTAACERYLRLHLHSRPEGIGTVAEGIVALSDDGWIVGANRNALRLLGLGTADIGATPLHRVLDIRLDLVQGMVRRRHHEPIQLRRHDGTMLYANLDGDIRPPLPARQGEPAGGADDALSRLDTGDAGWRTAADRARRIAGKGIPLLLQGESGVGKELFARAVHESSPQKAGPFVAINCAALPENLIESELFGYGPGAFTGARREGYPGRLREAEGGTLFLDEIGDMPLPLQTRLLRVLQERQVTPLGSQRPVPVNFALICATHRNLRQAVEAGAFRSDLYYRINGLTLKLPALRERSDFQVLTARLLADVAPGRSLRLGTSVLERFAAYSWPGNLRQYGSLLRTAAAMLEPWEDSIEWGHLPEDMAEELTATMSLPRPSATAMAGDGHNLAELSLTAIRLALEASRGNVSEAARRLGISRQTLYRKIGKR